MYAYSLFSLAFAKCPLNVFSALAFVSILGGFGKFTYLIGGIQLYKLSFKEGEIYEISSETRESPHASCSSTADLRYPDGYRIPAVSGNDAGRRYLGRSKPDRSVSRKSRSSSDRQHGNPLCNRVGVGMSEKNDGTGGIAALASWLMITTLLSTGVVTTIIPSIAESATKTLAFDKIQNPFIGILAGIIGSACYNRFKDTKLPDWLSFFSGKRCVAIVSGVVSIVVSAVLLLVWPLLFGALVAIGKSIVSLDVVGAGIYAFLNRLLIPTGLHHALNNVFWFDTIGLGDLKHFWAGETSADVTWSLGMYMSGFFPCMMFGIPGAALAMVRCAKPAKKKAAIGLVASAAVCAFICGVTEPFEFGFMFLAPALYVIYALLYGIFTMITVALGFRAGFSFSAGAMDLLFSSSLPAAQKIWLIIPLGIAAFLVFYFVFLFAIKKWDLKTPGREDDDLEAEKKVELASDNYTAIAAKILEGCGGKENITSIDNCVTRLRLEVKDITAVNDKVIKSAGVAGVIKPGKTSVQVIVGTKVQFVADAFSKLCE